MHAATHHMNTEAAAFITTDLADHPPLILGTLSGSRRSKEAEPVMREVNVPRESRPEVRAEIRAVREALADPRGARERTLDAVVDRLMNELTW